MGLRRLIKCVTALALAGAAGAAQAASWELNLPRGVTNITHEIYGLHMLIFWICVAIGVVVFGVMIYSLIVHRKARGAEASQFHGSTTVEIAWTIVPFVILIAIAIPAAGTLLTIEDSSGSDITVKVTGYQWLWHYKYLDSGVSFYSRLAEKSNRARTLGSPVDPYSVEHYLRAVDKPMVIPVHKKVRILLTSKDVIHSWWVPELSGKKDAIPGYINDIWFAANKTGIYRGQCAELCGRGHAYMPIVVKVVSQEEFKNWVAERSGGVGEPAQVAAAGPATAVAPTSASPAPKTAQTPATTQVAQTKTEAGAAPAAGGGEMSKADLMAIGEKIYTGQCAACHQPDGKGMPAAGFPALAGSPIATGPITAHIEQVLNGKNIMPAYKDSLSNEEIAGVVTYERNSFGNTTGDVVQPSQVQALR